MNLQPTEDPDKLSRELEKKIVDLIKNKLEHKEMTIERAKLIAEMVLDRLRPGIDYQQLMKVIPTLDDEFYELAEIILPIMLENERKLKNIVDEHVLKLIREGKIEQADKLMQEISD